MNFFIFIPVIIGYKFLTNLMSFVKIKALHSKYRNWLSGADKTDTLSTYKAEIIQLMKLAGVEDSRIPTTQRTGYGQAVSFQASVMTNLMSKQLHIAASVDEKFLETIGVYRHRCFESFSIFYWIELIIWLPKTIINYLGLNNESTFTKVIQIIWWFISPTILFFREQLTEWLLSIFSF